MDWQPLDFEKPIFELERRLQDLMNHSDAHDVDLDSAVKAVEEKLRETRREIYGNLTALAAGANRAAYAAAIRHGLPRAVLYKLD